MPICEDDTDQEVLLKILDQHEKAGPHSQRNLK
jgi:hypothetical protein